MPEHEHADFGTRRLDSVDVARGALLAAMLVVHVVSAHGTAGQTTLLHAWAGIVLVSAGFVALSGFVIGARSRPVVHADWIQAVDACCHLLLVMVVYGVLLSLVRHKLRSIAGGPEACDARLGWTPPQRFDDLGILLPIAIVQLMGPLTRGRIGLAAPFTLALALAWMLLPAATTSWHGGGVLEVIIGWLARRTLTPFYTVSYFVAFGLVGALLGRMPWRAVREGRVSPTSCILSLVLAMVLSIPVCSQAVLDPVYRLLGEVGGSAATLVYWAIAIAALLRGFAAPTGGRAVALRRNLALLGRNSLLAFVAHDFLLELNAFARTRAAAPKGVGAMAVMIVIDLAVLLLLCHVVERKWKARTFITMLLLNRSRKLATMRAGVFTLSGGLAFACVFAAYTSSAMARPNAERVIDDFESPECPQWWSFGGLTYHHAAIEPGDGRTGEHYLEVRGEASGMAAHGRGLFMYRDIENLRKLMLDVRGQGPDSGRIKIELYEDDNGNWEIEKDPRTYTPLYDDRFVYELVVDWRGWRQLTLPISAFRDDNPAVGNNVFDPARDLNSGGLLELQLLFSRASALSNQVHIDIDNLRWAP